MKAVRGVFLVLLGLFFAGGRATAQSAPQDARTFNPYRAAKDAEVGTFYLRKGDADAAIDRFLDAIRNKPDFAKPRRLLGEAYEKKGRKAEALKYYKEYLAILPKASDAKQIRRRIARLSRALEREKSQNASSSAQPR